MIIIIIIIENIVVMTPNSFIIREREKSKILPDILRHFRKLAKSDYYFRHVYPYVCLSAWNNSTPTGRIFMTFDI